MNNKILAASLLEWTRNSTTHFINADETELSEKAKRLNISLPSPDLAMFKTIYAEIDKVNRNGVILPRNAVENGLSTLIGKQINWEHDGAGRICGYIIDTAIEDDKIVVYGVLFKSLFIDEFEKVESLFEEKKLFVSFEIWTRDEKGNSVVHDLPDGNRALDPIIFHGCGLLLENPPACPNARVLTLLASKKEIEEAENIVRKVFEKDDNLVYAELAIEEPKYKDDDLCISNKGGEGGDMADKLEKKDDQQTAVNEIEEAAKWTRKYINELPDSAFAVIEPAYKDGTTKDKNARHLPHHDGAGDLGSAKSNANLDLEHYRNALARVNQIKPVTDSISADELRKMASAHLERHKDALEKSNEEVQKEEVKEEKAEASETIADNDETKATPSVDDTPTETKEDKSTIQQTSAIDESKDESVEEKAEEKIDSKEESDTTDTKPEEEAEPKEVTADTTPEEEPVKADDTPGDKPEVDKTDESTEEAVSVETKTEEKVEEKQETDQVIRTDEVKQEVTIKNDNGEEVEKREVEHREVITYTVQQVEEMKAESAKLLQEKDTEIEKLKAELDTLRQEIDKIQIEEANEKEDKTLEVGDVTKVTMDKYKKIQSGVNQRAFGSRK